MPNNPYTENAEKWKAISNIDYFTHFVKAWIPFNAWYRNSYPQDDSDAKVLFAIKTQPNTFKDRLVVYIRGAQSGAQSETENQKFMTNLSELIHQLQIVRVPCKDGWLDFTNLVVDPNPLTENHFSYRSREYKVEMDASNNKRVNSSIVKASVPKYSKVQIAGYNLAELESDVGFQHLSGEMRGQLKACYEEINPRKPSKLIVGEHETPNIKIGAYYLVDDPELIARAVITVIYGLRNALFHGEIVPNSDAQGVYEPAYHILAKLVQHLA